MCLLLNTMDYAEEQSGEIEALESIYSEELTVHSSDPHRFSIHVSSEDPDHAAQCVLTFTYTPTYPEEAPLTEIESEQLDDAEQTQVLDLINEQAEENLGMVMIFTLVSAVQERLHDIVEARKTRHEEEKERLEREREEAEKKKFEGTRVTVESFLSWKSKFDAEMEELKRLEGQKSKVTKKLTGKELFLKDTTLDDSDIKFLEEEGDTVQVDESLFEDLDDLEIED